MDDSLIKLLEKSGFTKKEALVYLSLLELDQGRVSQIAKTTLLKRPIVYVLLEGLIKRGYVSELPNKKINTYQAVDPGIILGNIKSVAKDFSEMLPILRTLANTKSQKPKIIYHETKEAIQNTWNEMGNAKKQFFITDYEKILALFPHAVDDWIKHSNSKNFVRHLTSNKKTNLEVGKSFKKINQEIRYITETENFEMDFAIYDDKLAITLLENSPCIVIIQSQKLVDSLLPVFDIAWKNARVI